MASEPEGKPEGMAEAIQYLQERAKNIVKYSDKLSTAITTLDDAIGKGILLTGLEFCDTEPFGTDPGDDFGPSQQLYLSARIGAGSGGIGVRITTGGYDTDQWLVATRREVKKQAVKRIPTFLANYLAFLAEKEAEFKAIAEAAEKMAAIVC